MKINKYSFPVNLGKDENNKYLNDWPVVYLLENGKSIYVGETNNYMSRMKQHSKDDSKKDMRRSHIIYDNKFNKSAVLDIESALIKYMSADGKFKVLNKNSGLSDSLYFDKDFYKSKIPNIWKKLQASDLANKDIIQIENSDLFKYSPYKVLSDDQDEVARLIHADMKTNESLSIVQGTPGTGKTILAVYLMKLLQQDEEINDEEIALVVPMDSLRKTLKNVVKSVDGLKGKMVISPSELEKKRFKYIIVDEAHRLRRYKNLSNGAQYNAFKRINTSFGFDETDGTELDWVLNSSDHTVLFYDENQSIKPTDVDKSRFDEIIRKSKTYTLDKQHRVFAGQRYINYISDVFENRVTERLSFDGYETKVHDEISSFEDVMIRREKEFGLSRIVSGYSFPWISKKDPRLNDVVIGSFSRKWNTVAKDWVNSKLSIHEVGCIHTIQGYDLNYIGIIVGKEIDYDIKTSNIVVNKDKYYDRNGKASIDNISDLKSYIANIYKTLFTRGIRGVHIYVMNNGMKEYLKKYLGDENEGN